MTHPLTPREKVALKPCPFCGGEVFADQEKSSFIIGCFRTKCGMEPYCTGDDLNEVVNQWNCRSAPASGSGDHAELAKSVGKAIDANIHRTSRLYSVRTGERRYGVGGQAAATDAVMAVVSPLLAENAALRSANTEAERKLAEAVGLLRETLAPGSFEGESEINARIRTFLSKEAERG